MPIFIHAVKGVGPSLEEMQIVNQLKSKKPHSLKKQVFNRFLQIWLFFIQKKMPPYWFLLSMLRFIFYSFTQQNETEEGKNFIFVWKEKDTKHVLKLQRLEFFSFFNLLILYTSIGKPKTYSLVAFLNTASFLSF